MKRWEFITLLGAGSRRDQSQRVHSDLGSRWNVGIREYPRKPTETLQRRRLFPCADLHRQ